MGIGKTGKFLTEPTSSNLSKQRFLAFSCICYSSSNNNNNVKRSFNYDLGGKILQQNESFWPLFASCSTYAKLEIKTLFRNKNRKSLFI